MELLLPWATAAWAAAAAAKRRRQASAAPGRSDAASDAAVTGSVSGSITETDGGQQLQDERGVVGKAGLKAATGTDVATAETAVVSAVRAGAAATPAKQNAGDTAAPHTAVAATGATAAGLPDVDQVLAELARPRYDAFTDFWDMNRDMG
jgi:hypothetical protein